MADIEDNRFYKIVMDTHISTAEKKTRIEKQLQPSNPDYADAVREYKQFRAHLAAEKEFLSKEMNKAAEKKPPQKMAARTAAGKMILGGEIKQPVKRRAPA